MMRIKCELMLFNILNGAAGSYRVRSCFHAVFKSRLCAIVIVDDEIHFYSMIDFSFSDTY